MRKVTQDTCSLFCRTQRNSSRSAYTWDRFRAPIMRNRNRQTEPRRERKQKTKTQKSGKKKDRARNQIPSRGPFDPVRCYEISKRVKTPSSIRHTAVARVCDGLDVLVQRALGNLERRRLPRLPSPLQLLWGNAELNGVLDSVD